MPSPFPGMDPYLENASVWPDMHGAIISRIRAALNAVLPPRYGAYMDKYVWLEEPDEETRTRDGKPDVYVADEQAKASGGVATLAAPGIVVRHPFTRPKASRRFVRIVDQDRQRVVTIIELLSPSNKEAGTDRDAYLAKRTSLLQSGTNLVEFDLLRSGHRFPLEPPVPADKDYCVLVSPAANLPQAALMPFSIRDPIPVIAVPLDPADPAVPLDLNVCLNQAYDEGPYRRRINYTQPPVPPLSEPDATWARNLLAAHLNQGASS